MKIVLIRVKRFKVNLVSVGLMQSYFSVSESDDLAKTEVQIMWVAPAANSGCVSLSAMVYENSNSWYSDDGDLTTIICEDNGAETQSTKVECCACDEAKYNVI